jgi:GNAT superfamily N-acetyltransferase
LESSRSSLLSRASLLRRLRSWPDPAKTDTDPRQGSLFAALPPGLLHPFRPAPPLTSPHARVQPGPQAWPVTGEAVKAPMQIARAGAQHLDVVLGLIEDARSWLWTKDTDQWEKPWPSPSARDARVLKGLQNGKTWIVWEEEKPAATVTIATAHNPAVWSEPECTCDLTERAIYVHRLITARKYAGCGLGAELIDWAGLRGRRKNRARWIRIDVWSSNTELHDYYKRNGFESCGKCADPDYPSGALLQRPVAGIRVPESPKFTEASVDSQLTGPPLANLEATAKSDLAAC